MAEDTLREIGALIQSHTNRHVEDWKSSGRPVIGYFCHYVPREIILAAGALPLRLRGAASEDSSLGDAYLSGRVCTYVRHVMSIALDGQYDFLDGEISSNTCDHVRRSADVFRKKTDIRFHGFLSVPRTPRESLYAYFLKELRNLVGELESHFGVKIDEDRLREAIRKMNGNRRRLEVLNQMRLEDRPKLSGAEALSVHIASQVLPPAVFCELADRLIEELKSRPGLDSSRGRLVLIGAELDEPEFVEAIESQGALVVADLLCFGARSVLPALDEDATDPLDEIGRAYFFSSSCARMIGDFPRRWENLKQFVKAARGDGVIFERIIFCDPWGAELYNILHRVKEEKPFPVLSLSREYNIVPTGQVKTRVQAFVEQIEVAQAQRAAAGGRR
jgi:benzoyl-CoA reductase/2-hydroxyglutaryl-CoA dehydratase subunit BcrC/BadD/HgdB